MNSPGESEINREQCFLLFATFAGDITRTAHAAGVSETIILKMCEDEGWHLKLGPILALKKSSRPGDVERGLSRAINFVQAHKMRMFIARVIHRVSGMNEGEFEEYLFQQSRDKDGSITKKLTTRALADLASALEKAQALTYLALADTAQDRSKRKESEGDESLSAGDLHARIAEGMAAVRASSTPRAQLLDAQLEQANSIVRETKNTSPNDNDNH